MFNIYFWGIMTNFSDAAKLAVEKMVDGTCKDPRDAWNLAISTFSDSITVQNKSCPKGAFLGLCEVGLVRHIKTGKYSKSIKNKEYALTAVKELQILEKPEVITASQLWRKIGKTGKHDGQMDVVLSLWHSGYIVKENISPICK